jgi:hypothetical protein
VSVRVLGWDVGLSVNTFWNPFPGGAGVRCNLLHRTSPAVPFPSRGEAGGVDKLTRRVEWNVRRPARVSPPPLPTSARIPSGFVTVVRVLLGMSD